MNSRLLAVPAVLLAAVVCAAPGTSFGQSLPQAFVGAGELLKTSTAESRNALLATLYERLFDLRDRKNRKQVQIDASQQSYRVHMDTLKKIYPDMSEEDILQAALKKAGRIQGWHEDRLVDAHRELTGVNGSLRAMRDILMEIVFVEQRIARHTPK